MRKEVVILGIVGILVVAGLVVGSSYYRNSVQNERKGVTNSNGKTVPSGELVRPDSWSIGPADAKVTLVEWYDPECESCAAFAPAVKKIMKDYEGRIRLVARYVPNHKNSMTAARFTEAAGEQGKYWQAQEFLFIKQPEWGEKHGAPPDPNAPPINALFDKYARELGLDMEKAGAAIQARKFDAKIEQDKTDARNLGVRRTPTFFVNGRELMRLSDADLRRLIDEELTR
jgi:protein-disulfide isomerase